MSERLGLERPEYRLLALLHGLNNLVCHTVPLADELRGREGADLVEV